MTVDSSIGCCHAHFMAEDARGRAASIDEVVFRWSQRRFLAVNFAACLIGAALAPVTVGLIVGRMAVPGPALAGAQAVGYAVIFAGVFWLFVRARTAATALRLRPCRPPRKRGRFNPQRILVGIPLADGERVASMTAEPPSAGSFSGYETHRPAQNPRLMGGTGRPEDFFRAVVGTRRLPVV
jgi:hypothetical protein